TSCSYTPQQNEIVKRKHRHILNVVRLHTYVLNRKSPYDIVYNMSHSLKHLRSFSYLAYATVLNSHDKFGSRSEKCVLVGYSNFKKGYKLWSLDNKQIVYFRDVKFFEDIFSFKQNVSTGIDKSVQDVNHLNFFNTNILNYLPEIPSDEERMNPTPIRHASQHKHWVDAMNAEMDDLYRNNTWDIVDLPVGRKAIDCLYDFTPGYFPANETKVCKLNKSLYGLKQSLRQWNGKLTVALLENDFVQSKIDYSLFTKSFGNVFIALLVYVDDIIITENRSHLKTALKVIMYLKGSPGKGINVIKGFVFGIDPKAYSDADWISKRSGHGFFFRVVEGAGALGSLGALKASTHHVITMFLYPLGAVEAACALEVDAMRALDLVEAVRTLDLVEVEAVVALDVVGLSLNIIISESLKPSDDCVFVPLKETMKAGLATLGLVDEDYLFFHPLLSLIHLRGSLLPPSGEVNVVDTADKSVSGTFMPHVTQPKAQTAKRPKKKKIPSSTQPETIYPEIVQTNDANITFLGSGPITMELDDFGSNIHSMHSDDLTSLTGFETPGSNDVESNSVTKEHSADNLNATSDGEFALPNASADVSTISNPLGHLRRELSIMSSKVDQLDTRITNLFSKFDLRICSNYYFAVYGRENLVILSSENENSEDIILGNKDLEDEPPIKKLKVLILTLEIPTPTPLSSPIPKHLLNPLQQKLSVEQFTDKLFSTTSSRFAPLPHREPTPPRDPSKGKGVVIEEPMKELIPYIKEGGYDL
nr:hypothetical protein [Tanacetum cinerariifolium]